MYDETIRKAVIMDRKKSMSMGNISKKYGIPRPSVQRILSSVGKQLKKRGPKEKINKNDRRRIRSVINLNIEKNIKTSSRNIIGELNLNVSRSTVCRNLKTLQYNYKALPSRFQISKVNKERRVAAARSYVTENINWNQVIFSDEKLFNLHGCESHYTWIGSNQSPYRVRKQIRSPGLMVWAMVLPSGLLSYQIMEGRQDTEKYIAIIAKYALPIIKLEMKPGFLFQQDNAPIHCSKKAKEFFNDSEVKLLNWPAYSPDINIIENIWHILSNIMYSDGPMKNLKELRATLNSAVNIFNETKRDYAKKLYESLPSRICDIIEKKGSRLKY